MLGGASRLTGASLQSSVNSVFKDTKEWVRRSAAAGKPWVVANDEQGSAQNGIVPDSVDPTHDWPRREVLWGNIMAGGAGIECYFGYRHAHSDLSCEDYRSRDKWWDQCRIALRFFAEHRVPFWDLRNQDALVSRGRCLAGAKHWVVQLARGGTTTLDLRSANGSFELRWLDPRRGGALQIGSVSQVMGGGVRALGSAPSRPNADWIALLRELPTASTRSYGKGCPGTRGLIPSLSAQGLPRVGNAQFALTLSQARPNSPAAVLLGAHDAKLALPGGCTLWVEAPFALSGATDATGSLAQPLPIPKQVSLLRARVFASSLVLDPAGSLLSVAALGAGLELQVGR